jgi:hypothetical protein
LHFLDGLARLVRDEPRRWRAGTRCRSLLARAVALAAPQENTPPTAVSAPAAALPATRFLLGAGFWAGLTSRLPTLSVTQPTTAFRLLTMLIWPPSRARTLAQDGRRRTALSLKERVVSLRAAGGVTLEDEDEGTSYRGDAGRAKTCSAWARRVRSPAACDSGRGSPGPGQRARPP